MKAAYKRIRIYLTGRAHTEEERATLVRAAEREFRFLQGVDHPGIARPVDLLKTPRGPALIFEHDPRAERLDHWLADHGSELDLLDRIELVRSLAEAVRHAHRQGLYHRALAPQHVSVLAENGVPRIRIRDWQAAARTLSSSTSAAAATEHIQEHVSASTHIYLAPETLRLPDPQPIPADIWSLGAVSFLILSGQPPAKDLDGLHSILREQGHLTLASAMDAPDRELDQIIRHATTVDATSRFVSVDEFLAFLGFAVEELTRPEETDPLKADQGEVVGETWTVARRVGTGSVHDVLAGGRTIRILTAIDAFTRECVALVAQPKFRGDDVAAILTQAGRERVALPTLISVDNGTEFTSSALDHWAYWNKIQLDFSRPGKPTDNAHIERFNATLRRECLSQHWFTDLEDARRTLAGWKDYYNKFRPHSSLGQLPPGQFRLGGAFTPEPKKLQNSPATWT